MGRSKGALVYSLYGVIYATFGLGVRHTGRPGRPVGSTALSIDGKAEVVELVILFYRRESF